MQSPYSSHFHNCFQHFFGLRNLISSTYLQHVFNVYLWGWECRRGSRIADITNITNIKGVCMGVQSCQSQIRQLPKTRFRNVPGENSQVNERRPPKAALVFSEAFAKLCAIGEKVEPAGK